ncbi:MAG: hypothetical protein JWM86_1435, partial [Thermoleophilia bacterium]|nr:hypothetical protein [Thermoleophilia bacterium]
MVVAGCLLALTCASAAAAPGPWGWSASARAWSRSSGTLPAALVARGPQAPITRGQFLTALLKIEEARLVDGGDDSQRFTQSTQFSDDDGDGHDDATGLTEDELAARDEAARDAARRTLMTRTEPAPALADATAGSAGARAVAYGWIPARGGKFAATAAITSNEAALATVHMLGLRSSVLELTRRLRTEVPGARVSNYHASQALVRSLGLRFNVLDP